MKAWHIGDLAIIVGLKTHTKYNGSLCEIVASYRKYLGKFRIKIMGQDRLRNIRSVHLRPLPPPQDTTTWDQCVWQPKELVRNERPNLSG